jgi:hypothetical protein
LEELYPDPAERAKLDGMNMFEREMAIMERYEDEQSKRRAAQLEWRVMKSSGAFAMPTAETEQEEEEEEEEEEYKQKKKAKAKGRGRSRVLDDESEEEMAEEEEEEEEEEEYGIEDEEFGAKGRRAKGASGRKGSRRRGDVYMEDEEEDEVSRFMEEEFAEFDPKSLLRRRDKASLLVIKLDYQEAVELSLNRRELARICNEDYFTTEFVRGFHVRFIAGMQDGQPVYGCAEINGIDERRRKEYTIQSDTKGEPSVRTKTHLLIQVGDKQSTIKISAVSNKPFTEAEFSKFMDAMEKFGVSPMSRQERSRLLGLKSIIRRVKSASASKQDEKPVVSTGVTDDIAQLLKGSALNRIGVLRKLIAASQGNPEDVSRFSALLEEAERQFAASQSRVVSTKHLSGSASVLAEALAKPSGRVVEASSMIGCRTTLARKMMERMIAKTEIYDRRRTQIGYDSAKAAPKKNAQEAAKKLSPEEAAAEAEAKRRKERLQRIAEADLGAKRRQEHNFPLNVDLSLIPSVPPPLPI